MGDRYLTLVSSRDATITNAGNFRMAVPNFVLNSDYAYQVCMEKSMLTYSWYTIDETELGNATWTYSVDSGVAFDQSFVIPSGTYSAEALATAIQTALFAAGHYVTNADGSLTYHFALSANYNTSKFLLTLNDASTQVRFAAAGLEALTGFDPQDITATQYAENQADINAGIDSVFINIGPNLIEGSYVNNLQSDCIYKFVPDKAPSSPLLVQPQNRCWYDVVTGTHFIKELEVRITDQNDNIINLRDDGIVIELHFRPILGRR